jgi:myo-inositol 2-dehydrogenase/D-chiro-inositol 1-dehydrogenase/scyllo-inositol 2-dehydrogenase (NAD+)
MTRKRICMVGAGRVGRLHTGNLVRRVGDRAEVTAICDPGVEVAQGLADDFGVGAVYPSLAEALRDDTFDAVVVTTPTFTHRDEAVRALEAGLHVHLEKPMAMNLAECRDISAAAEAAGRTVQLGFMRRFDVDFVAAAEQLAGGALGSPMIIKSLTHGPGLPPAWANDIRTSNGMLAEVNSHDLDTVCWFAGSEPVDISVRVANFKGAERGATAPRFYDTVVATITFASGALAVVTGVCPVDYGYDSRVEVVTTNGLLQVGGTGPGGLTTVLAGTGESRDALYRSWRDRFAEAYATEMVELVAAMDGAPVRVGTAEGTQAVALVLAGTRSLLEGRTVALGEVGADDGVPTWQQEAVVTA